MKRSVFVIFMALSSIACCDNPEKVVLGFYDWYFSVIGKQDEKEYRPGFMADTNGMVVIDMEKYIKNLRKYNCSENMIKRELSTYKECIKNVKGVRYENLLDDFDYDGVGCSYVYYYRWIHSQEIMDGVKIVEVKTLSNGKKMVKGRFYNIDEETKEYSFWDWYCLVILVQENKNWKIDDISISDK